MLTNTYDVLRSPSRALERIADEEDLWKSLNLQAIIFLTNGLTNESNEEDPLWLILISAVLSVPIVLGICFLMAGVTQLMARLFRGQGTWKKQFITLGYAMLPQLIFIPIQVIALFLGLEIIVIAAAVIASVWSLVLSVLAVSKTQKLGIFKSCVVLFAPSVILGILCAGVYISVMGQ